MQLSPHFSLHELTRTSTGLPNRPPPSVIDSLRRLAVHVLQPLRNDLGRLRITSGYRSPAVNAAVGGRSTSDHLRGEAADLVPLDASLEDAWRALLGHMTAGAPVDQAILYSGHIHVSYSETPRRQVLHAQPGGGFTRGRLPSPATTDTPPEAAEAGLDPAAVFAALEMFMGKIKIPTEELMVLVGSLLNAGEDRREIGRLVGTFLDDAIAFDELVPGAAGEALEAVDGPVLVAAAQLIATLFPKRAQAMATARLMAAA